MIYNLQYRDHYPYLVRYLYFAISNNGQIMLNYLLTINFMKIQRHVATKELVEKLIARCFSSQVFNGTHIQNTRKLMIKYRRRT